MQIHGPSVTAGEIRVRLNKVSEPFAVIDFGRGNATIHLHSADDAGELIRAATEARDLLLAETSEPVTDGRWCPAKTRNAASELGGQWQCTLAAGHEGRHEARGAFPLPAWLDGDTAARYDASGYDGTAGTDAL